MFETAIAKIGSQIAVAAPNPIGQAVNDATAQIVSALAQEMVAAVSQTAMKYTGGQGQMASFGLQPQATYAQAATQANIYAAKADQAMNSMRNSILGQAVAAPTRSLMPIAGSGVYGRR